MPRSAPKSQADKHRHGSRSSVQATTPLPQDLEEEDIIPGRLTQAQWIDMLNQEDTEETVGEIMDDLFSMVMEGCLQVDVKKQLEHYSACWALSHLTQTLEQQLLCLDEGEGPEELPETEDSEPVPATPDPWARGCVPVLKAPSTPHPALQQEVDIGQIPAQTKLTVNQQCNVVAKTNISPKKSEKEMSPGSPQQSEKETSSRRPVRDKHCKVLSPRPSRHVDLKKKQHIHLPHKPVWSKSLPHLSFSEEKKDVVVERRRLRHSISTGSSFQHKDSRSIPKSDPSCLSQNYILTQHDNWDNNDTNSKKQIKLPKLEQRCNKQQIEFTVTSQRTLNNPKEQPLKIQRKFEDDVRLKQLSQSRKEGMVSSGGALRLDTMKLAKGVSLVDPQTVDINFFKFNPTPLSTNLKPIQSVAAVPLLSVEQVTAGPPPRVTPLFQTKN